jgi:hypothetical protein
MKFHPSVLTATVGFAGVSLVSSTTPVNACDPAVVQQAADDGFMEYVVMNCMSFKGASTNFLRETTRGMTECLTTWISENSGTHAIPSSGDCRSAYQNFVNAVQPIAVGTLGVVTNRCTYDETNEKLTITIDCLLQTDTNTALGKFKSQSGSYIGGAQQCPAVTVRKLSQASIYETIITAGMTTGTNPIRTAEGNIDPSEDGGNAFCYKCYSDFYDAMYAAQGVSGTDIVTVCTDPTVSACLSSTVVQNAVAAFKTCSGGFDIRFTGPVCSATDVDEVQKLIPAPYFTFTHCAYNPTDSFCSTVDAYVDKIQEDSDSSCVLCYKDFRASLKDDALVDAKIAACTGAEGVYAAACKASSAASLSNFYACSGYQLNTVKPATAPFPVAGTPGTNSTTTSTTTLAPDSEASSMAPVDDTTKSATVAMTSGLALVAAAIVTVL